MIHRKWKGTGTGTGRGRERERERERWGGRERERGRERDSDRDMDWGRVGDRESPLTKRLWTEALATSGQILASRISTKNYWQD